MEQNLRTISSQLFFVLIEHCLSLAIPKPASEKPPSHPPHLSSLVVELTADELAASSLSAMLCTVPLCHSCVPFLSSCIFLLLYYIHSTGKIVSLLLNCYLIFQEYVLEREQGIPV